VLVVEDDAHNAMLFQILLEKRAGCRVTIAEAPEHVMELAAGGGVHLVIMDVSLSNSRWRGRAMSGVDLCRLLRGDARTEHIPILLATAHAMRGDAEHLLSESGANGYVAKPILDHNVFVKQVLDLLEEAA
jgi:CheY-like chemotaxis protein